MQGTASLGRWGQREGYLVLYNVADLVYHLWPHLVPRETSCQTQGTILGKLSSKILESLNAFLVEPGPLALTCLSFGGDDFQASLLRVCKWSHETFGDALQDASSLQRYQEVYHASKNIPQNQDVFLREPEHPVQEASLPLGIYAF